MASSATTLAGSRSSGRTCALRNYERIFGKQLAVLFDRDKTSYDLQYFAEHLSGVPSASLSEGELLAMMNGEVVWGSEDVIELDFEDADLDN